MNGSTIYSNPVAPQVLVTRTYQFTQRGTGANPHMGERYGRIGTPIYAAGAPMSVIMEQPVAGGPPPPTVYPRDPLVRLQAVNRGTL